MLLLVKNSVTLILPLQFATVEEPVRRKIRTSSTLGGGAATMRGFEVSPDAIDFGVLCEGSTYSFSLTVRNTGVDSCRFKIKQPPPSTGIKVLYSPGAVSQTIDLVVVEYAVPTPVWVHDVPQFFLLRGRFRVFFVDLIRDFDRLC